jgi:hypothetical protein
LPRHCDGVKFAQLGSESDFVAGVRASAEETALEEE